MIRVIALILAGLVCAFGVAQIGMGLSIAQGWIIEPEPGRYLGSKTTGEWIDSGIYKMVGALAFGLLVALIKPSKRKS